MFSLLPIVAAAGAWTPEAGTTQTILTMAVMRDSLGEGAVSAELYGERGLAPGWAFVVEPAMEARGDLPRGGERLTAVRREIVRRGPWVGSAQVGVVDGPRRDGRPGAAFVGAETRFMLGRGIGRGGWIDLEAGRRTCGSASATRWEAALGRAASDGSRAIVKAFGEDSACGPARARVQVGWVVPVTREVGVEVGWRQTVGTPDLWTERGVVIALWRRYR